VWKKCSCDELDRCGGSFDVQEDDADSRFVKSRHTVTSRQLAAECILGPSTPARNSGLRRCPYSVASSRTCPETGESREYAARRRGQTSAASRAARASSRRLRPQSPPPAPAAGECETDRVPQRCTSPHLRRAGARC